MKEQNKLYLYQSDIYYIKQLNDELVVIHTNDGREIHIEGKVNITAKEIVD